MAAERHITYINRIMNINKQKKDTMNRKIFNSIIVCTAMALPLFTGCSDDDDPAAEPAVPSEYIYVLNSGNFGANNAGLSMYDIKEGTVVKDIFEARNGRRLGNTGQDMILYGSKMYIAVYGESTVEVTDLEARSLKQISTEGQPRYFAVHEGKVYVTYYNGYVARIDTATLAVEATVRVGRNPEQLTAVGEKLYVANSGGLDYNTETGYDRTVSVIDLATFTETDTIEVVINPTEIESDHSGNVYIISKGNYGTIPNTMQKLTAATGEVSVMEGIEGTIFTVAGNVLYSIYAQWGMADVYYYAYDTAGDRVLSDHFTGDTKIPGPYQINWDAAYEHLFIMTSDGTNDGDVYIFDKDNTFVNRFEAGLYPMKAVYVKK
jgi:YVTN family beta-propeller protein